MPSQRVSGAYRVALAWFAGMPASEKNIRTDGLTVWSYWHEIGHTSPSGGKIARQCSYSPTTAKHCAQLRRVCDVSEPCPDNHGPKSSREPAKIKQAKDDEHRAEELRRALAAARI